MTARAIEVVDLTMTYGDLRAVDGVSLETTEGAVNAANFMVLPMAFLAGSFFPLDAAPEWLQASRTSSRSST